MSYINNMNPRRMIWFNQNAPKNKMDLWLSYNRHYEDTSDDETTDAQETTDNPSQRNCDLILKAWDCGRWIPIVGFNTTAANKIDIVEGNTLYHPAIFTGENPNDLYDAGTLGSLLSDPNFVTEQEWHDVFNSSNYDWGDIFGDTNWFGDLTWSIIQGGSSSYQLPRAQSNRLGGIWADTFATVAANGFAQCKFKGSSDSNLYVSGSDIIGAINAYYTSGGTTPIDIQLANTTDIGGIKADVHSSGVTASRLVEVKLFPTGNTNYERLSVNSDDIIDDIVSTFSDDYPLLLGGNGITLGQTLDHSQITWEVSNLKLAADGKYAKSKITGTGDHTIEWVDLPSGTTYQTLSASGTSSSSYVVKGSDSLQKHKLVLGANGDWTNVSNGLGSYYDTNESNYFIKSDIYKTSDLEIDSLSTPTVTIGGIAKSNNLYNVKLSYDSNQSNIAEYQYKEITISTACTLAFSNISNYSYENPVYIKIIAGDNISLSFTNTKIIGQAYSFNLFDKDTEWLLTIQFGAVRIDQIVTPS